MTYSNALIALIAAILIVAAVPARAVDGCKVLLCLAGPWQQIPTCASEVDQLFRDLAKGDPFPSCRLAAGAPFSPDLPYAPMPAPASAANTWLAQRVIQPDPNCPSQYLTIFLAKDRAVYGCRYIGMIAVHVGGQLWSKTYWNAAGGSVTELSVGTELLSAIRGVQDIADSQPSQATQRPPPG